MDDSALVRVLGFSALLIHGDLLVWDRWRWLRKRLPRTAGGEALLDVGCGTGAFTIGAARRGYRAIGLSWDERNQAVATGRAALCGVEVGFPIQDVRELDTRPELKDRFDLALCVENIEHIIDDRRLMIAIADGLKPGGRLLLTAPNYYFKPMSPSDTGPFPEVENGDHVRRGYSEAMLRELCEAAGLQVDEISSCSGFFSQMGTRLLRSLKPYRLAWALVMPIRLLPPILDRPIALLSGWPDYSICMVAYKPRFVEAAAAAPARRRPKGPQLT